jgi:hypothetical protein
MRRWYSIVVDGGPSYIATVSSRHRIAFFLLSMAAD